MSLVKDLFGNLFGLLLLACILAGCRGDTQNHNRADSSTGQRGQAEAISPNAFVFVPCKAISPESECLIIAAGGKRVLVGAPAGIGAGRIPGEKIMPDTVILTSLQAKQIEGLDEVRNAAWVSGRTSALMISGDEVAGRFVDALNEAYVTSDALAYIDGRRRGGFNGQAIEANIVESGDLAFDTGDLQVWVISEAGGDFALLVRYNERDVLVAGCSAALGDVAGWPIADAYIGCALPDYGTKRLGTWPLDVRVTVD